MSNPRGLPEPYEAAFGLFISWRDIHPTETAIKDQLQDLKSTFEHWYNYTIEHWEIPLEKPYKALDRKLRDFVDQNDGEKRLLIVFYRGHAVRDKDSLVLKLRNDKESPGLSWTAIQHKLLVDVNADILLILDCCHAASAANSSLLGEDDSSLSLRAIRLLAAVNDGEQALLRHERTFTNNLIAQLELSYDRPIRIYNLWKALHDRCRLWAQLPQREGGGSMNTPQFRDLSSHIERDIWLMRLEQPVVMNPLPQPPQEAPLSPLEQQRPVPPIQNQDGILQHFDEIVHDDAVLKHFFKEKDVFVQELARKVADFERVMSSKGGAEDISYGQILASLYQQVIYCDDSGSMRQEGRWDSQMTLVQKITSITTQFLPEGEGVALRFINQEVDPSLNLTLEGIRTLVSESLGPVGTTDIGTNLRNKILVPLVYRKIEAGRLARPLLVFIMTDGAPYPESKLALVDAILECGQRLQASGYPRGSVRFIIGQIGTAIEATSFLEFLSDNQDIAPVVFIPEILDLMLARLQGDDIEIDRFIIDTLFSGTVN